MNRIYLLLSAVETSNIRNRRSRNRMVTKSICASHSSRGPTRPHLGFHQLVFNEYVFILLQLVVFATFGNSTHCLQCAAEYSVEQARTSLQIAYGAFGSSSLFIASLAVTPLVVHLGVVHAAVDLALADIYFCAHGFPLRMWYHWLGTVLWSRTKNSVKKTHGCCVQARSA